MKQLQVAWTFDTGEAGGLQTSPIEVDGVLFGISPSQKIFAVDAATGTLKWKFDSGVPGTQPDRGLAYWSSSDSKDRRIIVGIMNFVYEVDAATGQPIPTFGDHGRVDLRENLGRDIGTAFIALTSPAVVYKD
ncbi:MAG: quinoprotein glucose dehydrogenase, partial [Acidobacteria bacterium]